jgi:hypothetical protein
MRRHRARLSIRAGILSASASLYGTSRPGLAGAWDSSGADLFLYGPRSRGILTGLPGSEVRVGLVAEVTREWAWQLMADWVAIGHSARLTADWAGRLRLARSQEPRVTRPRPAAKMSRLTRP